MSMANAVTQDRTGDLQIFSLTLSQLSYRGLGAIAPTLPERAGNEKDALQYHLAL